MIDYEFKIDGLREVAEALLAFPLRLQRAAMARALRAGGNVLRNLARQYAPFKSGKLRRSIRVSVKYQFGMWRAYIVAGRNVKKDDPYYALFVHQGTKAHVIKPVSKKSLAFAGRLFSGVDHPGSRGNPFMERALKDGSAAALDAFAASLRQELGNFEYSAWGNA